MSLKDKAKWNRKFASPEYITGKSPCPWLTDNADLLTGKGYVLDLAMGEGRNGVYLATLGYEVLGVDISEKGVKKAQALAHEKKVKLKTETADLDEYHIKNQSFDLIVCFNFLDRRLFPSIRRALKPGGWIYYETFNEDYIKYSSFRKEWVLGHKELLKEFDSFRIWRYREIDNGETAFSSIVAQKPDIL